MEDQSIIVLWIWLGIAILFLITLFATLLVIKYMENIKKNKIKTIQLVHKSQTDYLEKTLDLQEKDRQRLAEELHDNIIAKLNLIRLNINNKGINDLNQDLKNSMQFIRELSHNLTPPDLGESEFSDLITDYLEQINENISVSYWKNTITKNDFISNEVKLNLFRILQELITNILKHANATKIDISLRISLKHLILKVEDNGCGFTVDSTSGGIGLRNIRSRAKLIKAVYKLKTKPEKGTKFIIYMAIK